MPRGSNPNWKGACKTVIFRVGRVGEVWRAFEAARPTLDAYRPVWCHGDFQTAHVLIDPAASGVQAILDFADHRIGEPGWDLAVLTLYDETLLAPVLDGYRAGSELRAALTRTLPLYRVLRLLGSVRWLARPNHPAVAGHRARIDAWAAD